VSGSGFRLGVVLPERHVVSESFIQAQIDGLSEDTVELWGSPRPLWSGDRSTLLSGTPRLLSTTLRLATGVDATRAVAAVGRRLPENWYRRQLAAFLCRSRVDVMLAEYGPTGVVVMNACRRSAVPLVVHFHGYDAYQRKTLDQFGGGYLRLFEAASKIIAVSKHMVGQLEGLGAPPERIVYNPYGVDVDALRGARPGEAEPILVALGRFVEKKAPTLTVRAFADVHRQVPQSKLVMLGDGPLRDDCIELAREFGVEDSVSFPGSVDHDEVASWMRRARCFVQHSVRASDGDSEGTPLAILEASSCGLPVVSTRHTGIVEAVRDGATGFLVEEGDVEGMASKILRLVADPGLAAKMGSAGRQHIEAEYSIERSLGRLRSALAEAVRDRA
jgi:glycosyltransferase involved in cell wall biosynthesis